MKTPLPAASLRSWHLHLAAACTALCATFATPASAQVLLEENFTFTGALTSNGWTAVSATNVNTINAAAPGLSYPNLPSSGVGNAASLTTSGEDDRKLLSSTNSSGSIYSSCLVNISAAQANGDYFYTLSSGTTGFIGRVFARSSGSGFQLGILKSSGGTATPTYDTNVLSFGTTYLVATKISRLTTTTTDDVASLWVNPVLGGSEPSPNVTNSAGNDQANIDSVVLRQGSSGNAPTLRLGNILVGTDWASVTPNAGLPVISPSGSFTAFSTFTGTASASQSLAVTSTNLTAAITITAPAGMQVSSDNASFGPVASLPSIGGTFFARVAAAAPAGSISSSITLSSAGATDVAVAVAATVRPTSIALPYGPDTFETNSFPWYSLTVAGTRNWTRASAGGNSFMEINGFDASSNAVPANAWLILGPFNVPAGASNVVAQFNVQRGFTNVTASDAEFTFKFSTNYNGVGNPSAAAWSDVSFPKPAAVASTDTTFSPSGAVPLPASVAGRTNLYVAYQLQATNATNTSRWRMDDFELFTSSLPVLSVLVNPSTIDEGQGAAGTVTLPSVPSQDVNVTVTSADPTLLQVDGGAETVVTIPAGATPPTAQFGVTTTRNYQPGADVPVQIAADGGAAYEFGQAIVTVRNIDLPSVSFTSAGYSQNFAGFTSGATLPTGWSLGASIQSYSAWATTDVGAKFSSASTNVFGYQHTGDTGTVRQVLTLKNDTGAEINEVTVSYLGRATRLTEPRQPSYVVSVDGVAVPALAYSTGDGDNVQRRTAITGLFVSPGQTFEIAWTSDRGSNASGASRQIGLGDVSVSLGTVLFPPAVASLSVPLGSIGQTSAQASADVTADNGSAITARGFVYAPSSVNPDPLIGGSGVVNVADPSAEVGVYTATLTGLTGATQYSIKAYATNAQGTTYTAVQTFTTLGAALSFGGNYLEPFNNFTATTSPTLATGVVKDGWTAISSTSTQAYSGAWSSGSLTGGFYGGASDPGVLGYQHTSGTGTMTVTLRMVNDTGAPLTQLYLRYLGRVELVSGTRFPKWDVTVAGVAAPDLTYSTASGTDETKTALVTGLSIPVGGEFTVTWVSDRDNTLTGNSRRIGLANVVVSTSAIPAPAISVSGSLTAFATTVGTASASQSFNASGVGLTGNIAVTAPANYEVSLDNTTFAASVSLAPLNGTVASTPVYVRIAASAPLGSPAGTVSLASTGATTQNVAVTGTVSAPGTPYDAWADSYGLNPATNGAPTADPDGDSFSNAQEFAFGTNPTQGNAALTRASLSGGNLTVTYLERNSDVTYAVQNTSNLAAGPWNPASVTPTTAVDQTGVPTGYTRKQFSVPATGSGFYRVTATTTP